MDKYDLSQFRTVPNRKIKSLRHSRRTLRSSKMRIAGEWEPVFRRRLHLIAVLLKILNSKITHLKYRIWFHTHLRQWQIFYLFWWCWIMGMWNKIVIHGGISCFVLCINTALFFSIIEFVHGVASLDFFQIPATK